MSRGIGLPFFVQLGGVVFRAATLYVGGERGGDLGGGMRSLSS